MNCVLKNDEFEYKRSKKWVTANDPGTSISPLCGGVGGPHGCGWSNVTGCKGAHGPAAAMQDHEIVAVTWEREGDPTAPESDQSGPLIDVSKWKLSSGEAVSPLVWSPGFASPLGKPFADLSSAGMFYWSAHEPYCWNR